MTPAPTKDGKAAPETPAPAEPKQPAPTDLVVVEALRRVFVRVTPGSIETKAIAEGARHTVTRAEAEAMAAKGRRQVVIIGDAA